MIRRSPARNTRARTSTCSAYENGKIAEHWDSVPKSAAALKYDPNTQNEAKK